eukprot:2978525-Pleurochrysis_carterae.AAC.1
MKLDNYNQIRAQSADFEMAIKSELEFVKDRQAQEEEDLACEREKLQPPLLSSSACRRSSRF